MSDAITAATALVIGLGALYLCGRRTVTEARSRGAL